MTFASARMPSEDLTLTLETTELPIETVPLVVSSADVSTGFILVEVYKKTNTLKYGREYSIAGMKSSSVTAVVLASPFRTPSEPIRITSAECSLGGEQQKSAVVLLKGVKLGGDKDFNLRVQKMEGSTPTGGEIVLSGKLSGGSSSTTHTHSELIFGISNPQLSFDTMYLITQFKVDGEVSAVDSDVTFFVPDEPPKITGAGCSLNGKKDVLIVELTGTKLISSDHAVVISGSFGQISSSGGLFNVSSTKCFVNFSIGSSEDSTHVVFGGRYELLSVGSDSSSFVVNTGLFIDAPRAPRITKITTPSDVSSSSFVLSVSGEYLPSGETFTVTLIVPG
ncbi:hypothetical protein BLNAU_19964 [Blattamonas nauphoetae]|uniref:Uncharacterized protein n=1 Tax=Blattamonas nauphoetae TaxID=2049346 RepID=A0ABQ9X474_9EUKA|nr:hypothetical protein BLNAU_19964 [Blattamonas nauphoetae]